MTLEESRLIDKYEVLFAQEGWKELVEDLVGKRASMASELLYGSSDHDDVMFKRGLASGYQYIIGLERFITQYKAQQLVKDDLPDVSNGTE